MNRLLILILSAALIPLLGISQDCSNASEWDSNTIYNDGDQAVYNNTLYEANWWSQNQHPSTNSGQYQVWTNLGECNNSGGVVKFIFPLEAPGVTDNFAYWNIGGYPDLDPTSGIVDYNGGTSTYNNHHGTDMGLGANGWTRMDLEIVNVVAAAQGVLVEKNDGEYDRRCGGSHNPGAGNYVKLEHADGTFTIYAHLKKNTVTTKPVGSTIAVGEYLGKVGSSGNSSGPHLHFDVRDENNQLIDPNNVDPALSRWINPPAYLPSAMPDIILTDTDIQYIDSCGTNFTHDFQSEFFTRKDVFTQGESVKIFRYYNNTRDDQTTYLQMIRPDGSQAWDWTEGIDVNWQLLIRVSQHDLASNAQTGTWTFRETYNGVVYERHFDVVATGTTSGCTTPSWSSSAIYHSGDKVEYNGNLYEAQWYWIENQPNPEVSSPWGAWSLLGTCTTKQGNASDEKIKEVVLYPNPATDFVTIEGDLNIAQVKILNAHGNEVMSAQGNHIDVSTLREGIYILQIESDKGTNHERLIVK